MVEIFRLKQSHINHYNILQVFCDNSPDLYVVAMFFFNSSFVTLQRGLK